MNRRSLLASAYGAVAFGVANAIKASPAFALPPTPISDRATLKALWAATMTLRHSDGVTTNAQMKAVIEQFLLARGLGFPVIFRGKREHLPQVIDVTLLGFRTERLDDGTKELSLVISCPSVEPEPFLHHLNTEYLAA